MKTEESIYDAVEVPEEFVRTFIWWAYWDCPNQSWKPSPCGCGANNPVFTDDHLSNDCRERITSECNQFWALAKDIIRNTKGRCNWSPSVDTDSNHVADAGTNFFYARRGDHFFMDKWPQPERDEFYKLAARFGPMFVREENGSLIFVEGLPPTAMAAAGRKNDE